MARVASIISEHMRRPYHFLRRTPTFSKCSNSHTPQINMNQDLYDAYKHTTYLARTPLGEVKIRPEATEPLLDALLADHNVEEWAFITAWNPGSQLESVHENHERQRELERAIEAAGFVFFRGSGVPDSDHWQPEESVLVLGISQARGVEFGRRFGQEAILCGRAGEAARLVWCMPV